MTARLSGLSLNVRKFRQQAKRAEQQWGDNTGNMVVQVVDLEVVEAMGRA